MISLVFFLFKIAIKQQSYLQLYNFLVIHSNFHKNLVIYILSISIYIDYRYTLNFPHIIQVLIPYHTKNLTHPSNICTPCPKCTFTHFFPYFSYPKQKSALKLFSSASFLFHSLLILSSNLFCEHYFQFTSPVHNLFRISTIFHKFVKFKFTC